MATSPIMLFRRSSNSPRYFAPAIMAGISRVKIRLSFSVSGTFPSAMRCASPSTTAVFPTPGSPMRQGLFFCRRERMRMTRSVSFSRPMMGSICPDRALSVRLRPNFNRVEGERWSLFSSVRVRSRSRSRRLVCPSFPRLSRPREVEGSPSSPPDAVGEPAKNPKTSRFKPPTEMPMVSNSRTATQSSSSKRDRRRCSVPT